MKTKELSLDVLVLKWSKFWVDWFMNLFADPDYYWVEETYPGKKENANLKTKEVHKYSYKMNKVTNIVSNKIVKNKIKYDSVIESLIEASYYLKLMILQVIQPVFNLGNKYSVFNI